MDEKATIEIENCMVNSEHARGWEDCLRLVMETPESALTDIRAWCSVPFKYIRCGINKEHIEEFGLIENPEKPGTHQWEALSEGAAEQLILGSLERFWSLGVIKEVEEREARAEERWREIIEKVLED